jgi:hypothetical protein
MRTDSPEDRLLHLIRGKSSGKKKVLVSDVSKKILMKNKALKPLFSGAVNKILVIILVFLGAYLAYSLLFPVRGGMDYLIEGAEISQEIEDIIGKGAGSVRPPGVEDYSVYAKGIAGKKLFSAPFAEEPEGETEAPDIDISRRFNLVGIISGDNPQAIIEDTEAKKTHYLYEGQALNEVTVVKINEGRVTLEYKGKEVMLVL